jgi:hypothetical protein
MHLRLPPVLPVTLFMGRSNLTKGVASCLVDWCSVGVNFIQ